jgi:hypothetical protein
MLVPSYSQVLLLNGYVTMMSYAARVSNNPDDAAATTSSAIAACEFFLAGGPDPGDDTVEPDTGSCWTGFSYFSCARPTDAKQHCHRTFAFELSGAIDLYRVPDSSGRRVFGYRLRA